MAGGIDWFRWHHGSVTDPKFQLVARRAGASLPDVLAVWAYILEKASASTDRGAFGEIDAEALDCLFNFPNTETRTADVLAAMADRGLIADGRVCQWEARQPKRERDPAPLAPDATAPLTSTERSQRRRAKQSQAKPTEAMQRHATPCNASDGHATPRVEERREEEHNTPPPPAIAGGAFARFWDAWPKHPRKVAEAQCEAKWASKSCESIADQVIAALEAAKTSEAWRKQGGEFIPAPLVWLNQSRWEAPTEAEAAREQSGMRWHESRSGIEAKGVELGLGAWDEGAFQLGRGEPFKAYERRVREAAAEEAPA